MKTSPIPKHNLSDKFRGKMVVHIWQHWGLIKALAKKRIILRNKITAVTTVCFLLMGISILLLAFGTGSHAIDFHLVIGHLYILAVVVHTFAQFRTFIFRSRSRYGRDRVTLKHSIIRK